MNSEEDQDIVLKKSFDAITEHSSKDNTIEKVSQNVLFFKKTKITY